MPYINVSTSARIDDKKELIEEISILVSSLTNKSRRFVMAKLDDNLEMFFDERYAISYSLIPFLYGLKRAFLDLLFLLLLNSIIFNKIINY